MRDELYVSARVNVVSCLSVRYYYIRTLYTRVMAYIKNGWAREVVDPDGTVKATSKTSS